ncbi:hypothetical protein [Alkalihalobacillus sp. BA299]|uniref:hypothetical protein n=1 Tax=Alkalihalobacillus sp. BA299 TaxID=2815938 RepID=UPI001ADC6614|nr:hypothetical protein [Alkalihalobacillus sp. BA299]
MGKRGIMQHGLFKTFLTRGKFKSVFKPLIYKKEDHVHSDFLNAFLPTVNGLNLDDNQLRFVAYWLYIVPKELFEEVFIANENGEYYLTAVKESDLKNGHLCAYYTQAFVLWYLEQILKNSEEFGNIVGISIEDFEYVITKFYGAKNLTMQYLDEIRTQFDLPTMQVDPRDWGIIYVHNIYDLLINDEQVKYNSINKWDKDIIEKNNFIAFIAQFFADKKEQSLIIMNN